MSQNEVEEEILKKETHTTEHEHGSKKENAIVLEDKGNGDIANKEEVNELKQGTDQNVKSIVKEENNISNETPMKSKKRLTLQERLAQAAKAKSKINNKVKSQSPETKLEPQVSTHEDNSDLIKSKDKTIDQLKKENHELSMKIVKLNEKIDQLNRERDESSSKETKLNDTIEELRKEGHELSLKELKLNETIKKLKSQEQTTKNDLLNEVLANLNFSSIDEFVESYDELKSTLDEKDGLLAEGRIKNNQYKTDLSSKDDMINHLKNEMSSYINEISRLEEKMEALRTSTEFNSAVLDFEEYSKLNESHHNLQKQYLSSQENWKTLESELCLKIDNLSSTVDSLKKGKIKQNEEINKLSTLHKKDHIIIEELQVEKQDLHNELEFLNKTVKQKDDEYQQLVDKFDKLQSINNQERLNLNSKIESLTKEIENSKIWEEPSSFELVRSVSLESDSDIPMDVPNSNIQLINKMSSNINRLEIELTTLKEEHFKLIAEKENSEQDYLKIKDAEKSYKLENNKLSAEVEQLRKKESTMLELIGEKSELVEELRADVADLKDLCKLQVQQLIDFQEAK